MSKTALIGLSLAFGLGIANVAELGAEGIERFAIGLGISAIVAAVRMADERERAGKALSGAAGVVHKFGMVVMLLGGVAWAIDYAAPWSTSLAILGLIVAAAAWFSVYLPRRSVSKV